MEWSVCDTVYEIYCYMLGNYTLMNTTNWYCIMYKSKKYIDIEIMISQIYSINKFQVNMGLHFVYLGDFLFS